MARPNKKGLDILPLDVDFFDSDAMVAVSGEFGLKGEITVIKLLCAVYRNGYFILWNELFQMRLLRSLPGVSVELLNQIVDRLVKWGLFDKELFISAKVLTSADIQRHFFNAARRRKRGETLPYLLITLKSKISEQPTRNDVKTSQNESLSINEKCIKTFNFFNEMTKYYNSSIRPVKVLNDSRRIKLESIIRSFSSEQIATAIKNAMTSDYLNGRTSRRTVPADFDWIFQANNFTRIYEGSI